MTAVEDELAFLLRSDSRTELVAALDQIGTLDRYELEERVDASRRTVTRTLDALVDRGYIEETGGGYTLTAFGSVLVDAYRDYRREASIAEQYRPFLRHVSADSFDLDPTYLEGAELTVGSETAPFAVLNRTLELRSEATHIRELAPAVERRSVEQLAERIRDDEDINVELVLPPDVLETAESADAFAAEHRVVRESDAVDVYVSPDRIPLFIGVMDGTVALAAMVNGEPRALIESDRSELREWAERRLDDYCQAATALSEY